MKIDAMTEYFERQNREHEQKLYGELSAKIGHPDAKTPSKQPAPVAPNPDPESLEALAVNPWQKINDAINEHNRNRF